MSPEAATPEAPPLPLRRGQRLRTVDFSRPTKFTGDLQRRISRAMESFCQTAGTKLSSELRWPVELEVLSTSQLTWASALAQQAPGQIPVLLEVDPINTRMLLTIENALVLVALESLLGGTPERPSQDRRFSEIDWSLTARILDWIAAALSAVWEEIGGLGLRVGEVDPTDAGQLASVSEPTFAVGIECRVNQNTFTMSLLVPWIAVEPVAGALSGRERAHAQSEDDDSAPIHRAMSDVTVALRAEVAAVELPVETILSLKPGDLLPLHAPAEDGVTLYAENTRLAPAQPGAAGTRRAVQISTGGGQP